MSPEQFRRIEALFHAARNASPEQRAALLADADSETRREVELLLCEPADGEFLARPAFQDAPELLADLTVAEWAAGISVGPYRIESELGEGGMGKVFRAVDTRLNRAVAIKTARFQFGARFEREGRAIASLNHPNICQVYDVGPNYLVMELIDGPTLADRLKTGGLPVEEALAIAHQIGDALVAAHEKGIIHRDLKPANIKVKADGTVKVLDFGLAKICAPVGPTPDSPTVSMEATRAGQVLGTAAYMSPEQARGKPVDKRADIWAFGVVLYEMLAGRRLFQGETISDSLAGVLTKEPDWEQVPARTRPLLKSCLEKEPGRRLRDIGDAWRLMEVAPAQQVRSRLPSIAAAVFAITTAVALWAPWRAAEIRTDQPAARIDLDLGTDVSLAGDAGPAMAISRDGTRIIIVSQDQNGVSRLFHHRLDQGKTELLPGTEGAAQPFFSPDNQWVGFFAAGKLKKKRVDGGDPVSLCDAPSGRGASWGEDGNIIAALTAGGGLSQIPAGGGNAVLVTKLEPGEACHRWPHVMPGGDFVLFTASRLINNFDEAGIALLSLRDHSRRTLLEHAGMYPRYLASGHLAFVTKGSLFAIPFDAREWRVTGAAARLEEVASDTPRGFAQVDFSTSGIVVLRTRGGQGLSTPQWLDAAGKTEPLGLEAARYHYLRLSPDGGRLAYVSTEGSNSDLFVYDWQRSIKTRLTNRMVTRSPVWSPDGRFVVFTGAEGMFAARTDGGGVPEQLTRSSNAQIPEAFSPGGRQLLFTEVIVGQDGGKRVLPLVSEAGKLRAGEPQPASQFSRLPDHPSFSKDGRWVAYAKAEGAPYEIYVRAFPDKGTQVQVSNSGGILPIWSPNGHELFYRTEDQRIMVIDYSVQGDSFIPRKPRQWYGKRIANIGNNQNLDLLPDGKRFVVLIPADGVDARESQSHITLVTNYFEEVRRRLSGGQPK